MATLPNLAISLLRLAGEPNVARGLRWASRNPIRTLALLACNLLGLLVSNECVPLRWSWRARYV
jgi:hypothetical protein